MADETFKAFIGGLPYDSLESDIETLLEHCSFTKEEIRKFEIHLVHDRETSAFKGFGYVNFETEDQLNNAISNLNGVEFASRRLKVNRAQQRDRSDRGGRGGGRGGFGGDRGGRGGRGGGEGGFRRGGGGRFNDNERRGGFGGGGGHRGGYRQRKESDDFGGSQHGDGHNPRNRRQSEESGAPSAPPAERPRFNFKPRTTDAAEIEARKKQEEEETKKRQEKLFQ